TLEKMRARELCIAVVVRRAIINTGLDSIKCALTLIETTLSQANTRESLKCGKCRRPQLSLGTVDEDFLKVFTRTFEIAKGVLEIPHIANFNPHDHRKSSSLRNCDRLRAINFGHVELCPHDRDDERDILCKRFEIRLRTLSKKLLGKFQVAACIGK